MTWAEYATLLILATAMSFTPGPNTTLSTALAANLGLKRAMRFVCAVPVGWALLLTVAVGGVGQLVLAQPALAWGIKALGVGYLLWLAFKLAQANTLGQASADQLNVGFAQGIALQFVNIKAWMFALSIVAGWVAGKPDMLGRFLILLPTMVFYAFVSNFTYALVGASLRNWLAAGSRLKWFNRLMALVLVLTAAWMVTV
jgi:threonine/homoserine/homoserine lactone efflux protein